jgi:GNAT superfamily N-acetyltransferase
MPHGIQLRPLEAGDLDAISRIHWRACSIAYRFMDWTYTEPEVQRWYEGKLGTWDWGLVGCTPTGAAGFIATIGDHIDQLFVDPDMQRQGIGSTLLAAALRRIPGRATLHVFEANAPARAMYDRMGFRASGSWLNAQDQAIELLYVRD